MSDFGRVVAAARQLLRWTQRDLAEKSGLSFATIRRLEHGDGHHRSTENLLRHVFTSNGLDLVVDHRGVIGASLAWHARSDSTSDQSPA